MTAQVIRYAFAAPRHLRREIPSEVDHVRRTPRGTLLNVGASDRYTINYFYERIAPCLRPRRNLCDPVTDAVLRAYAQNADVSSATRSVRTRSYASKEGWGHSIWRQATRLAMDARVGRLILFHQDPAHDDGMTRAIESEARQHFDATEAAQQSSLLTRRDSVVRLTPNGAAGLETAGPSRGCRTLPCRTTGAGVND